MMAPFDDINLSEDKCQENQLLRIHFSLLLQKRYISIWDQTIPVPTYF